jgi:hypothetical protein
MEHLAILEKICNNISDSLEPGTAMYVFAAAIHDTWWSEKSTELEQNLAKRLVSLWKAELNEKLIQSYRNTQNDINRPEADDYYKKWLEKYYKKYNDNIGARRAVWQLWEDKYGIKIIWSEE